MSSVTPTQTYFSELQPDTIVVGFTGSLGSGCTYIAEGLAEFYSDKCRYYRLSDFLRQIARNEGETDPSADHLQDLTPLILSL